MKGWKLLLMSVILCTVVLSGCSKLGIGKDAEADMSAYDKIQKSISAAENYKAEATVEYINNKGSRKYETLQHGKATGQYRIEVTAPDRVAGNITLSDGKLICQRNPRIAGKISVTTTESKDRLEILFTSFVKNYLTSNEVSVNASTIDESKCTVLEAIIPGEHQYLTSEKLWVDNETLKPVKLVIYDAGGSERIIVTYKNFEYNVAMEDGLFTIE